MIQIFSWIWVLSGVLLILLVLLHSPKGDGMGGIAASGSSMFNSASSAEASLNKITWTFLVIFLSLAIILSAGWWHRPGGLFRLGATARHHRSANAPPHLKHRTAPPQTKTMTLNLDKLEPKSLLSTDFPY